MNLKRYRKVILTCISHLRGTCTNKKNTKIKSKERTTRVFRAEELTQSLQWMLLRRDKMKKTSSSQEEEEKKKKRKREKRKNTQDTEKNKLQLQQLT